MRAKIPKEIRDRVLGRYNGKCYLCGSDAKKLSLDHIHPVRAGGSDDESNLAPACYSCNNFKMTFTIEQLRVEVSMQAERARKYSVNFRIGERFGLIVERKKEVKFFFETVELKENEK